MIKNILNVEDKLFSTVYGEVSVCSLVENTGHIIKSTKEAKEKKEVKISISLPNGIGDVWEDFNMFGFSLDRKSKLKTLFKDKESAIRYLNKL